MKYITKSLKIIFLISLSLKMSFAENHNLVVIQKVDSQRESFVIQKGMKDQIYEGQRSLFSNKSTSVVAKVISVNREFSQWELEDQDARVSFTPGDIITISYSVEKIWTEIPRMLSDRTYKNMLAAEEKVILQKKGVYYDARYQFMAGLNYGISESTSFSENNEGSRSGQSFKFKYTKSISNHFKYEVGIRIDNDLLVLNSPEVQVDTQRYFVVGGLQTNFKDIWNLDSTPYASISFGYGRSQSQIEDFIQTGTSTIVPSFCLGIDIPYSKTFSFLTELTIESISSVESFSDGVSQKTNITQAMLSIGFEIN